MNFGRLLTCFDPLGNECHAVRVASGLDDYPRSSTPGPEERHADLVAWLAAASGALARVATALGDDAGAAVHSKRVTNLLRALDDVHWDDQDGAYYDVGLHSERGTFRNLAVIRCASARDQNDAVDETVAPELLQQGARDLCPSHHPRFLWPIGDGAGNILTRPTYIESDADKSVQFVRRVGVVNIFPMLLRLLPEDSPRLPRMLDLLADKDKLWSAHGMRSLGKRDMCVRRIPSDYLLPAPRSSNAFICLRCACTWVAGSTNVKMLPGMPLTGVVISGLPSTIWRCNPCITMQTVRSHRLRRQSERRRCTKNCGATFWKPSSAPITKQVSSGNSKGPGRAIACPVSRQLRLQRML
jgi:hypothetical protein